MHISLQTITGNGILDLVAGIWTKFKLGTGIWEKLGLGTGIRYLLHDPLLGVSVRRGRLFFYNMCGLDKDDTPFKGTKCTFASHLPLENCLNKIKI